MSEEMNLKMPNQSKIKKTNQMFKIIKNLRMKLKGNLFN